MSRILACVLCFFPSWALAATLLVFGDSLSAGYGIEARQSWPSLLQARLAAERFPHRVVNASISGETTAGGRSRLPALLKQHRPAIVILALGANDGLRGLPLVQMRANLTAMVREAKAAGARVLLVGMRLPPNYGPDYTREFNASFAAVAKEEKVALLPFLLEPIALDEAAFLPDRLHPTAAAQAKLLDHVWPALLPILKRP
ncbi:MAG: arylesterase [Rhodocyclaceae bacterium]|nr:arylesterase [Rhodocyclaceae bacterium]